MGSRGRFSVSVRYPSLKNRLKAAVAVGIESALELPPRVAEHACQLAAATVGALPRQAKHLESIANRSGPVLALQRGELFG